MEWLAEIFPFLYQFIIRKELHRFLSNLQNYGDKFGAKILFVYGTLGMNNHDYFKALRNINLKYDALAHVEEVVDYLKSHGARIGDRGDKNEKKMQTV